MPGHPYWLKITYYSIPFIPLLPPLHIFCILLIAQTAFTLQFLNNPLDSRREDWRAATIWQPCRWSLLVNAFLITIAGSFTSPAQPSFMCSHTEHTADEAPEITGIVVAASPSSDTQHFTPDFDPKASIQRDGEEGWSCKMLMLVLKCCETGEIQHRCLYSLYV